MGQKLMTNADAASSPVSTETAAAPETAGCTVVPRALIDEDACMSCGVCSHLCSFGAIEFNRETRKYFVNRVQCEGCYVCIPICPTDAITMTGEMI